MGMQELKNRLEVIKTAIPEGSCVYFFDYPVYNNIGDMLIWKGSEKFFKQNCIHVKARFSYHSIVKRLELGEKVKIPPNAIIVCQGGGNFGDLYWAHQKLRRLLVSHYPLHRIVILPQTVHYGDETCMAKDLELFSQHSDLHIFVRDLNSYQLLNRHVKNIYLSPDMAHYLYPINYKQKYNNSTLFFLRQDKEKMKHLIFNADSYDWYAIFNGFEKGILHTFQLLHNSSKANLIIPPRLLAKLGWLFINHMIKKGVKLFGKNNTIITSRLHGHILACLMGINNQLIDNSYGKNSSYYKSWTKTVPNTELINQGGTQSG